MGKAKALVQDLLHIKSILICVLTPIILSPFLIALDGKEAACAYVVVMMAIFWVTEALPIAVTAFLPVFMFPMVGVLSTKAAAQQYINDTNMLFVGGLIMAAAIEHWNIHRRIALFILLRVGSEPRWLMLGMMLPTWFLSMWISNTATTAMMVPIASAILKQLEDVEQSHNQGEINPALELDEVKINDKGENDNQQKTLEEDSPENGNSDEVVAERSARFSNLCKALSLSIAYAANVGGVGSLTGTGPNLVLKGQLDIIYEKYDITSPITFASWLAFGVPLSFCLMIVVWLWLQLLYLRDGRCCKPKDVEASKRVRNVIVQHYKDLGPVTFAQAAVMGHFIVLVVLWITRDMGGEFGWGSLFQKGYVKDAVPAVFIATLLFLFPSRLPRLFCCSNTPREGRESLPTLMTWEVAVKGVPWGVMFLLGGGFSMAYASQESGLSRWLGDQLGVLDYLEPWVLNLVLCYIVAAATEVTSNTATCTLMMPILANLAIYRLRLNPLYVMFPSAVATSFAFMLPVATPPNAVVFSYGYVRVMDMVKAGFILNVVCVLVLILFSETLGNHLFDFHTLPAGIAAIYNDTSITTPATV